MLRHERNAPIWLFSFVDLAFLLLIAFTQIAPDKSDPVPDLAELEIPRISGPGTPLETEASEPIWQLRVYPPSQPGVAITTPGTVARPYALLEPRTTGAEAEESAHASIDVDELEAHLQLLRNRAARKPVLAPHKDSRAEDLLVAVSLLEDIWASGRTVAVRPESAVSAAPDDDTP